MTADPNSPAGVTPERVAPVTLQIPDEVSIPQVGIYMNEKHQYWCNGEGPYPSVTTLLGLLDKPAVGVFKAKEAARAVYRNWGQPVLLPMDEEEAIKWALTQADLVRDKAANLGSSVHLLADLEGMAPGGDGNAYKGFEVSDGTKPYLEAYRAFLDRYSASSIVSSEHAVWSLNGYAGTYDLMMQLPKQGRDSQGVEYLETELWLIDIKTSGKGPYPEWGLQLAGYRWADYIVLPGDPTLYPMPEIQRTGVLHLRPDLYPDTGWRLIEYPITYKDDFIPFLGLVELWRWKESKRFTKSRLVGRKSKP